jgi:6-phosphogluconolactonase
MNRPATQRTGGAGLAAIVIAIIITLTGSVGGARTMVYVANADSREIYALELNLENGSLKVIEKVSVNGSVMPLAISPDRRYLYAALRSEPFSVSSFAINADSGKLTLIKSVLLPDNLAYISTDRTGRYLFGASYAANRISINAISVNGQVSDNPLALITTGKNAHCILTDPSNRFLFVSNLGVDSILQYRFDESNGRITANDPAGVETKQGAGPRHLVFHPKRHFMFSTNELDGTVNTYSLNASGTLTMLGSISVLPADFAGAAPAAADLHLTPDGRFLYASERTSSTLAAFLVNADSGQLTLIGNYPTEIQPRGFNIDPGGKYLLAAGQKSNRLSVHAIDQKTGVLRKVSHIDVGKNPNWVEIVALQK